MSTIYYRLSRESDCDTAKRFNEVIDKINPALTARKAFTDKHKIASFRPETFSAYGGISSVVCFEDGVEVDKKIWGKGLEPGEYMPKQNSNAGKALHEEITNLPVVSRIDLNKCIKYGHPFQWIGFAFTEKAIFFATDPDWLGVDKCELGNAEEITFTDWKNKVAKEE